MPESPPRPQLPLDGLKVLDLSWIVAGPTVGRAMADFGATVIRVESQARIDTARVVGPFHGDEPGIEHSALYGNVNAGKLGLALNLRLPEARQVVRDLARWADVVSESFTAGVLAGWGLDYAALSAERPGLIMLSSTLLGQTGPQRQVSGFGTQGAAMSGIFHLTGWPDRPPCGPFGPYTDYPAPRFALTAVLAALDHRRRTGQGCHIDQAQAESTLQFLAPQLIDLAANGNELQRRGNDDGQSAPHGVYPCRPQPGRTEAWVAIAVADDDQWHALAAIIGSPDQRMTTADRLDARNRLDAQVESWTSQRSAREAEETLQAAGIPAHALSTTEDAANDLQLQHRNHFLPLPHPLHDQTTAEAPRCLLSQTPGSPANPAPQYGEHADLILHTILQYDADRIAALAALGALG